MNKLIYFFLLLVPHLLFAQDLKQKRDVSFILDILGKNGVLIVIGLGSFIFCYVNSIKIFAWIDEQTSGTRE